MSRMPQPRRCYIHVGLPKTGTSFVQSILRRSREEVARQGLDLLPGDRVGVRYISAALRGKLDPAIDPPAAFGVLTRLREEVRGCTGDRALISNEVLGSVTPEAVLELLEALPGYEIHVVVTVRDLSRTLPSAWQQSIQGGSTTAFDAFVDEFVTARASTADNRRRHVLHSVLDTWETQVPPERIHIVTVPPRGAGPDELLNRFCRILELDPTPLLTDTPRENSSLGVVQAELLRRVNLALGDRLPHRRAGYLEHGKHYLARTMLLPQGGRPPRLPSSVADWCAEVSDSIIARLSEGGYPVVGDLEELRPDPDSFSPTAEPFADTELLESAVQALASVLEERLSGSAGTSRLERKIERQEHRIAQLRRRSQQPGASTLSVAARVRRKAGAARRRLRS